MSPKWVNGSIATAETWTAMNTSASSETYPCSSFVISRGHRVDCQRFRSTSPSETDAVSRTYEIRPPARAVSQVTAFQPLMRRGRIPPAATVRPGSACLPP